MSERSRWDMLEAALYGRKPAVLDVSRCFHVYFGIARERIRDALNAVRRLTIYHDDILCAQLHSVTVAVVEQV